VGASNKGTEVLNVMRNFVVGTFDLLLLLVVVVVVVLSLNKEG
jgi:hypothetical protein